MLSPIVACVLLLAVRDLQAATSGPTVELPPGPAATRLARESEFGAPPAVLSPELPPAWFSSAWSGSAPWEAWSTALEGHEAPAGRLQLMRIARALDRPADAWAHFALLPPDWARAALPELLLGPPTRVDGKVQLSPILPPVPVLYHSTWAGLPPKQLYSATGLDLLGTQLSLGVEVAPEGVEVRLTWEAGPPLELLVQIPTPPERKARLVYVDWDRVDLEPDGYPVSLAPAVLDDTGEHVLWARCEAVSRPWPQLSAASSPLRSTRLVLVTTPTDPELERLRQAAHFLASGLKLDVTVETSEFPEIPPPSSDRERSAPIRVQLAPGPQRDAKLRDLLAQAERTAMSPSPTKGSEPR